MIGRVCVTGGAGFIGSHMVRTLLDAGIQVTVFDNLRTGRREFLNSKARFYHADITTDHDALLTAIDGCDWVVHLAANPDARGERRGVQFNLGQNVQGTANVLDAMQHVGTTRILYASSASIYGNTRETPVPEDFHLVPQASFYGASKLAGEGLIGAYCEMYGFTGILGRWVHILGERYLHGHIIDFLRKLRRDPSRLHILGDGRQAKSGLHARNLCEGLLLAMQTHDSQEGVCEAYNFGGDTLLTVRHSADLITKVLAERGWFPDNKWPVLTFSGRKDGGWVGDNPHLVLDSTKARNIGWAPTMSVPDGIRLTAEWLTSDECSYL
jgi:UDP-glucose 4-epimerase